MFRRFIVGRDLARATLISVLFTTTVIVGCRDPGPTNIEQVMAAVSNLSDAARDSESFDSLFVDGAAPADAERLRYSTFLFNMDQPTVIGETAKVNVQFTNAQGEDLGIKEWVFVFDAGQWMIQSAPLP